MKKTMTIRNVTIGEGNPKICASLTGATLSQLKEEAGFLNTLDFDVAEWRVDFFEQADETEQVLGALKEIRANLPERPLIFTFRTANEGGEKEISKKNYLELNRAAIASRQADLVDVELFSGEETVRSLVEMAHANGVLVIVSNHDFSNTPPKEEIIARLCKAQEFGGDLPKIAVMPTNAADVLTLLDATCEMNEKYADRPIITMSMGSLGAVSRVSGGAFGSALTFGSARKASAPGQIPVQELRKMLDLLSF